MVGLTKEGEEVKVDGTHAKFVAPGKKECLRVRQRRRPCRHLTQQPVCEPAEENTQFD